MAHDRSLRFCPILVGRNTEYAMGTAALARAGEGWGGAVLLSGEAGMGKSRLMRALTDAASAQGFHVIGGICQEHDRDYPFAPFVDALRQQAPTTSVTSPEDLLGPERAQLARLLPELDPPCEGADPPLPPEQEKRRLFETYVRLFARLARAAPLLITLEDMHWADEASIELLQLLPRRLAAARVLIIVTARSDEPANRLDRWMVAAARDARTTHLALAPLTHEDVAQMVAAMVETPVPAAVIDTIDRRAEGNPFIVEELVHAVAREQRTGAAWQVATERHIPAGIAEMIARRLDQCSAGAVVAAECAAVIGPSFSFELLQRVANKERGTLIPALRELMAAHLVVEGEAEGTHAFAFRHALTRDAIYRRLLGPERQRLHRQVGRALGAEESSRPPSESELAHHYFAGEEWKPALEHSQRAGEQAQALYAPHAAIEHFSRALIAAAQIGAPTMALVLQRAQAYEWIAEMDTALRAYESVRIEARAAGDRASEWLALTRLTRVWGSRDHARAMALCQDAIALARTLEDRASLGHNLIQMGAFAALYGEPAEAQVHLEEALAIFQSLNAPQGCADALEWLGVASVTGADLLQATAYLRRAIALFRTLGDRAGLTRCLVEITQRGATLHGDWLVPETTRILDAAADGEEALALARESGWRYGEAYSQAFLALCVGAQGDYGRALSWAESALAIGEETGLKSHAFIGHGALGILSLDLLALPAALRHIQCALTLARAIGSLHYIEDATGFLVSAHLANDEPAKAAALLADALPPETPARTVAQRRIWLARAELALAQGDPALALRIVDDLIASVPNIALVEGRGIPRLSRLRGDILMALGRYAEAEATLAMAAATAQAQGARPLLWRIHLALGTLHRTLGHTAEAGQSFATVREIVEEIARTVPDTRLRGAFIRNATALIPGVYPLSARRVSMRDADGLTARERAVIVAVTRGQSNREMAAELFISEKTAEWHISNCLRKLGFRTRAELAAWAVASGLAPRPSTSRAETAIP